MHSQHNHIYVLFFYIPWLWDRIVISTQISVCVLATLTHSLTHTHSFLNVHAHQTLTSIEHIQNRFSWNDLFHWPTVTLISYQWKHIWLHQLHSTSKTSVTAPCSHHCLLAPPTVAQGSEGPHNRSRFSSFWLDFVQQDNVLRWKIFEAQMKSMEVKCNISIQTNYIMVAWFL